MKTLFSILLLFLVLISSGLAEEYQYDSSLGTITLNIREGFFEKYFSFGQQAIISEEASFLTGQKAKVTIGVEVPCQDTSGKDISGKSLTGKIYITSPNGNQDLLNFPYKITGCSSALPFDIFFTPLSTGKYSIHYVVMQDIYPSEILKEVKYVEAKSPYDPSCEEKITDNWSLWNDIENGKVEVQYTHFYDKNSGCKYIKSDISYRTVCKDDFVIEGTTTNKIFEGGQKECVEYQAPSPLKVKSWIIFDGKCKESDSGEGYSSEETCLKAKNILVSQTKKIETTEAAKTSWLIIKDKCTEVQSASGFTTEKLCKKALEKPAKNETGDSNGVPKASNIGLYFIGGLILAGIIVVLRQRQ